MKKLFNILMLISISPGIQAQEVYSLQRCRELALQNNRQLKVSRMAADVAENTHKAAKTKYLPRVDALAGYQHFSREISLLNDKQKQARHQYGRTAGRTNRTKPQFPGTAGSHQPAGSTAAWTGSRQHNNTTHPGWKQHRTKYQRCLPLKHKEHL